MNEGYEMPATAPADALRALCRLGATGEVVCVANGVEVHVYLHTGRLAWATASSVSSSAFTRALCESCQIDRDSFAELIEDCRINGHSIASTLVTWGLGTLAQVRDAVEHQLRDALKDLIGSPTGSIQFLDRQGRFDRHDEGFSFDGVALIADLEATLPVPRHQRPGALVAEVMRRVPGARWAQLGGNGGAQDSAARFAFAPPLPPEAWNHLGPVEAAIIRSSRGISVGLMRAQQHSALWVGLEADAMLGPALRALATCLPAGSHTAKASIAPADGHDTRVRCVPSARSEEYPPLRDLMARTPDVQALAVCQDGEPRQLLGQAGVDASALIAKGTRYASLVEIDRAAAVFHPDTPGGAPLASMALLVQGHWYFMTELAVGGGAAWLVLPAACPQGLGWALLDSIKRALCHEARSTGGAEAMTAGREQRHAAPAEALGTSGSLRRSG